MPGAKVLHAGSKAVSSISLTSPARANSVAPRTSSSRTTFQRRQSPPTCSCPTSAIVILDTFDQPLRLPVPTRVVQFCQRMNIGSDRLGIFSALDLQTGLGSASCATPNVRTQPLWQCGKPRIGGHWALDHKQLPDIPPAQPSRPAGPLSAQLERPLSCRWNMRQVDSCGGRRRAAQRARKTGDRLLGGVIANQGFDRPERPRSDQSQVGNTRFAIDQEAGEQSDKPVALGHDDHPQSARVRSAGAYRASHQARNQAGRQVGLPQATARRSHSRSYR